jgi:hypothetical protein
LTASRSAGSFSHAGPSRSMLAALVEETDRVVAL